MKKMLCVLAMCMFHTAFSQEKPAISQAPIDRTSLPIREQKRPTYSELDVRKTTPPARFDIAAPMGAPTQALKPGKYTLVYDFKYDGGDAGEGGTGTISVDGKKVAEGRIDRTQSGIFSVDDLADVGMDEGTQVADYGATSKFNGKIEKLKIETRK